MGCESFPGNINETQAACVFSESSHLSIFLAGESAHAKQIYVNIWYEH